LGEARRRKRTDAEGGERRARRNRAERAYTMTPEDIAAMEWLVRCAAECFDGHLTIMKFTGNWRVGFGTLGSGDIMELRADIAGMAVGTTLAEAAEAALADPRLVSPMDYEFDAEGHYVRDRERDGAPHHKSEVKQITLSLAKHMVLRAHYPAGWPDNLGEC
jgi:hypothetical protein